MSLQNEVTKAETAVKTEAAKLTPEVQALEAKVKAPITVKLWVAIAAVVVAAVIGHLL